MLTIDSRVNKCQQRLQVQNTHMINPLSSESGYPKESLMLTSLHNEHPGNSKLLRGKNGIYGVHIIFLTQKKQRLCVRVRNASLSTTICVWSENNNNNKKKILFYKFHFKIQEIQHYTEEPRYNDNICPLRFCR